MIAIDTNVLVRVLVDDLQQPQQTQKARALVQQEKPIYLTQIVQIECIWVLKRVYKQGKNVLLKVLDHFHKNPDFVLQHPDIFVKAVDLFRYLLTRNDTHLMAVTLAGYTEWNASSKDEVMKNPLEFHRSIGCKRHNDNLCSKKMNDKIEM